MTPLAIVLSRIGWTAAEMGRRYGYAPSHASDMASGRRSYDPALVEWLERVADAVEAIPPPRRRPYQRRTNMAAE